MKNLKENSGDINLFSLIPKFTIKLKICIDKKMMYI